MTEGDGLKFTQGEESMSPVDAVVAKFAGKWPGVDVYKSGDLVTLSFKGSDITKEMEDNVLLEIKQYVRNEEGMDLATDLRGLTGYSGFPGGKYGTEDYESTSSFAVVYR